MRYAAVVGRGLNYANAFEFALKLMETCYVVAERFSSADFMHGPIALVEPSFPVFAFAPPGVTWPSIRETLTRLQGLRAEIVAITDSGNREVAARATRLIELPRRVPETLDADPLHRAGATLRRLAGRPERPRSGPAPHPQQDNPDDLSRRAAQLVFRLEYLFNTARSLEAASGGVAPLVRICLLSQRWPYIASFSSISLRSVAPSSETPANRPLDRDQERISAVISASVCAVALRPTGPAAAVASPPR